MAELGQRCSLLCLIQFPHRMSCERLSSSKVSAQLHFLPFSLIERGQIALLTLAVMPTKPGTGCVFDGRKVGFLQEEK